MRYGGLSWVGLNWVRSYGATLEPEDDGPWLGGMVDSVGASIEPPEHVSFCKGRKLEKLEKESRKERWRGLWWLLGRTWTYPHSSDPSCDRTAAVGRPWMSGGKSRAEQRRRRKWLFIWEICGAVVLCQWESLLIFIYGVQKCCAQLTRGILGSGEIHFDDLILYIFGDSFFFYFIFEGSKYYLILIIQFYIFIIYKLLILSYFNKTFNLLQI